MTRGPKGSPAVELVSVRISCIHISPPFRSSRMAFQPSKSFVKACYWSSYASSCYSSSSLRPPTSAAQQSLVRQLGHRPHLLRPYHAILTLSEPRIVPLTCQTLDLATLG